MIRSCHGIWPDHGVCMQSCLYLQRHDRVRSAVQVAKAETIHFLHIFNSGASTVRPVATQYSRISTIVPFLFIKSWRKHRWSKQADEFLFPVFMWCITQLNWHELIQQRPLLSVVKQPQMSRFPLSPSALMQLRTKTISVGSQLVRAAS